MSEQKEAPYRSLAEFDPNDPSHIDHLREMSPLDAKHEANQPACCCEVERDARGAVLAHPPDPSCPLHQHQVSKKRA